MIYSLQCGVCGTVSNVESDLAAMEWNCSTCLSLQTTSVPCDEVTGEPLKDVGHGSIVAVESKDVAGDVIKSDPVDTYEKSKVVEEEGS